MHKVKNKMISFPECTCGERRVPRMEMEWVATAAINQAPLIPSTIVGLSLLTVTAEKKVYMIISHSRIASAHK